MYLAAKSLAVVCLLCRCCVAWDWGRSGHWTDRQRKSCTGGESLINYTTITGFFLQDDPSTNPSGFDYANVNFGLINRTYDTDAIFDPSRTTHTQWQRFAYYINTLNKNADFKTQYKVVFFGRHGEGYHNIAESYYGTPAWNCYWSKLPGNGTIVWEDAHITPNGVAQAVKADNFWRGQIAMQKQPAPQSYYTSPLTRCLQTANLTFSGLELPSERPFVPTVKEFFREGISMHTCDHRSNKTYIHEAFPTYRFENGFTEFDELWTGMTAETAAAEAIRSKIVLDDVFTHDDSTWVSVTSHSGEITALLGVLGHRSFSLSTGQVIPVLIKAVNNRKQSVTTSTVPWEAQATCTSPPVTSLSGVGCVCSSTPTGSVPSPSL